MTPWIEIKRKCEAILLGTNYRRPSTPVFDEKNTNSDTLLDPVAVSDSIGVLESGTIDVCNTISEC